MADAENAAPTGRPSSEPLAEARPEANPTVAGGGDRSVPSAADAVAVEGPAPFSACGTGTVSAWVFRHGKAPRRIDVADLPRFIADDANVAWIDLEAYAAPDLRDLAARLALPDAAVEAALTAWQRPRLDVFDGQFRVCATVADPDAANGGVRVLAAELDLFIRPNALVSAHRRPLPFADRVLARACQSADLPRLDACYLLYVMLDELLHHGERLCEAQEDAIADLEERAVGEPGDTFLNDLIRRKRAVFALGRLVDQHREVFAAFLRPEFQQVSGEAIAPYFRDLEGRLAHLLVRLADAKAAVDGAFDLYVSHTAHRTNEVMRLLTIVSTVLLPATVILGLFGTSFEGVPIYSRAAFAVMALLVVLVTGAILFAFRRRGWLATGRAIEGRRLG